MLAALLLALVLAEDAPARKTVVDPKDATPDMAIQGEYAGPNSAAQVVAEGKGRFAVAAYRGGLPGAGWDGKPPVCLQAISADGQASVKGDGYDGSISGGVLTLKPASGEAEELKRVERASPTLGAKPPEGAVVLFDGSNTDGWAGGKIVELSDGNFLNVGTRTRRDFGASTLHVEFRLPFMPEARGQGRANSGVYLQDRYEVQVLDSFGLAGENNECGGIYTLHKPAVNACSPPMVWQTYDIDFTPAVFGADGTKTANARATVRHNGVLIHDNVELKNATGGGRAETAEPGPFSLQNHGNPVVFRNVWAVPR